jgi:F0F1-type ATP synthase epsilon subunit
MKVAILDAQHTLFEGVVSQAILPASGGELSFMDNHEPLLVALTKGYIRLQPVAQRTGTIEEGAVHHGPFLIHRGVARMKGNALVILVE